MYAGSRGYIREKWDRAKWDIENILNIYNPEEKDAIDEETMSRVRSVVVDSLTSIINEVSKK